MQTANRDLETGGSTDEADDLPIAPAGDFDELLAEVQAIPEEFVTVRESGFVLFQVRADYVPHLIYEVTRQREIAFRMVGEGTGQPLDRDRFDDYYEHLILWDEKNHQVAGGYRVGKTDELLAEHGPDGLYCGTLFQFEPEFLAELNPSIELGRSFVRAEYQKAIRSLAVLWKGIMAVVGSDHRYHYAFGPVSISQDYSSISKSLIVEYMNRRARGEKLAARVRPRNPFRAKGIEALDFDQISESLVTIEDVSARVSEIEPDGKGLPVLLRQYFKWNAKILSFNLDPDFSNVLDALILVDFRKSPMKMLQRYMGKMAADSFVKFCGEDYVPE